MFCLLSEQYLFMKGRIENIFTDELYSHFAAEITGMLQFWKPKLLPSGMITDTKSHPITIDTIYGWLFFLNCNSILYYIIPICIQSVYN